MAKIPNKTEPEISLRTN